MTATEQPLSKPDKPGRYRVQWSNGDVEEVEVIQSSQTFWFRTKPDGDLYRVKDGWLGKWEAL